MNIGVDIEDISRFEDKSQAFLEKVFTKNEQEYCNSKKKAAQHYAVRFCAKEAVIKALSGFSVKDVFFEDIEIYHDENQCPQVRLLKKVEHEFKIKLSVSHDKTKAVAFAVIEC